MVSFYLRLPVKLAFGGTVPFLPVIPLNHRNLPLFGTKADTHFSGLVGLLDLPTVSLLAGQSRFLRALCASKKIAQARLAGLQQVDRYGMGGG